MEKPPEAALEEDAVEDELEAVALVEPLWLLLAVAAEPDDALEDLADEADEAVLEDAEVVVAKELVETDEPLLLLLLLLLPPDSSTVELTQL